MVPLESGRILGAAQEEAPPLPSCAQLLGAARLAARVARANHRGQGSRRKYNSASRYTHGFRTIVSLVVSFWHPSQRCRRQATDRATLRPRFWYYVAVMCVAHGGFLP